MIVTVLRSRLKPGVHNEYVAMASRMKEIAEAMPGYISDKDFVAPDGERVTVVEFESEDTVRAWRQHPEHIKAQKQACAPCTSRRTAFRFANSCARRRSRRIRRLTPALDRWRLSRHQWRGVKA